ncbi:MAG: fatty acid--CoA ligase family protein [Deinococcales bacterium]
MLSGCDRVAKTLGYRQNDSILCPVPWSHDYGWGQLLSLYFRGIPLILPKSKDVFALCEAIEKHQPSILAAIPALCASLVRGVSPIKETKLSSIRLITSTGAPFPQAILQEIKDLFKEAKLCLNYGLTETYRSTSLAPDFVDSHYLSVGKPIEGVSIIILRQDDHLADVGEVGEVVHRGEGVFIAYWGDAEKTQLSRRLDTFAPDISPDISSDNQEAGYCVYTGDLGWLDEEGFLYLVGRRDRQIKTMDMRVGLDEVEAILLEFPLIAEVAVAALPHEIMGNMIVAAIVPRYENEDLTKAP